MNKLADISTFESLQKHAHQNTDVVSDMAVFNDEFNLISGGKSAVSAIPHLRPQQCEIYSFGDLAEWRESYLKKAMLSTFKSKCIGKTLGEAVERFVVGFLEEYQNQRKQKFNYWPELDYRTVAPWFKGIVLGEYNAQIG